MSRYILLFCLGLTIYSCANTSKYEGFSVTYTGLNYQIHTLGEPYQSLADSDFISYNITVYSRKGELLKKTKRIKEVQYYSVNDTGIMEFLGLLNVGDSGVFVSFENEKEQLFGVKLHSRMEANKKHVSELLNFLPEEITIKERKDIQNLLGQFNKDSIQFVNGIYLIKQISGSGNYPEVGNEVVFHMESENAQGINLESTRAVNKPFSYFLGDQDQVILGLDIAIRAMKKGGRTICIIPSNLAFGAIGSNTKIVKPNEALLYTIDLMNVFTDS